MRRHPICSGYTEKRSEPPQTARSHFEGGGDLTEPKKRGGQHPGLVVAGEPRVLFVSVGADVGFQAAGWSSVTGLSCSLPGTRSPAKDFGLWDKAGVSGDSEGKGRGSGLPLPPTDCSLSSHLLVDLKALGTENATVARPGGFQTGIKASSERPVGEKSLNQEQKVHKRQLARLLISYWKSDWLCTLPVQSLGD